MHRACEVLGGWFLLVLAISVVTLGCGGSNEPSGDVSGTVTFNGTPVEEGTVTLFSSALGAGGEASLAPGGTYSISGLPLGTYQVSVTPPTVEVPSQDQNSSPSEGFKQVDNIPDKYRNAANSGISVDVKTGTNTLDIEMK